MTIPDQLHAVTELVDSVDRQLSTINGDTVTDPNLEALIGAVNSLRTAVIVLADRVQVRPNP